MNNNNNNNNNGKKKVKRSRRRDGERVEDGGGGGGGGCVTTMMDHPTSPATDSPHHLQQQQQQLSFGVGGIMEGQQGNHPLLNDCILSSMIEWCPTGQLSNLRLVCKAWHERSLSRFRKSATVSRDLSGFFGGYTTVFQQRQLCFVNAVATSSEGLALELDPGLMEKYNLRNGTPFRNFRFCWWDVHGCQLRQSFWSNCGAWMRSLTLEHCAISTEDADVEAFDRLLFETTPNLEMLKLRDVSFDGKCYSKYYARRAQAAAGQKSPVTLRTHPNLRSVEIRFSSPLGLVYGFMDVTCLLSNHRFPNLKKLGISTRRNDQDQEFIMGLLRNRTCTALETLFNSMVEIRLQDPSAFEITNLEIFGLFYKIDKTTKLSEETATLLEKLRWPLRSLSLDVGAATEEQVLQKILCSCSDTLEKLELHGTGGSAPYENFPFGASMPCLQVLKTRGPVLPSIACLNHFPNLRVLEVLPWRDDSEIIRMEPEDIINFVLPHLVTFKFQLFHPGSAANVRILAKGMPNLEEISMQASSETFRELCSLWSNSLRKLEISVGADVDEYVLTGIRKSAAAKLQGRPKGNLTRRLPNITNLIHLQEFRMHETSTSKSARSTKSPGELAFEAGFRQLPNLRCLKLFDAPEMTIM